MPLSWKLYRLLCVCQVILALYLLFASMIGFVTVSSFAGAIRILVYLMVASIAVLAINILNKNYPDTPITGRQKSTFNWLFLLNFLFLALLFGFVIAEYRSLKELAALIQKDFIALPASLIIIFIAQLLLLLFQLIILYGLYELRRFLHENFTRQQFEFEKSNH